MHDTSTVTSRALLGSSTKQRSCLNNARCSHRAERTLEAERRLGEMWMISGELEQRAGDVRSAKLSLLRAKGIFSVLAAMHFKASTLDLVFF